MGLFSKLGAALKNEDFLDSLTAMSMSLNGNEEAALALQDKIRGRRDMARVTEMMNREGYGTPGGNVYSPDQLTPVEAQESRIERAPPPLLNRDSSGQVSAEPAAPFGVPNLPTQQVAQPKSLYAAIAPDLMRMAQRGQNVQPIMNMLATEDYVRGLPMQDQAAARAVGPDRYAGWQREDSRPQYIETPGAIIGLDRRTPREIGRVELPQKPEPVTPDRIQGAVLAKYQRGEPLTPQEQAIFDRWRAGSDGFYGERAPQKQTVLERIVAKLDAGEPLAPGEQEYWNAYKNRGSGGGIPQMGEDELDEAPPPPAPATPPGGKPLPRKDAPKAPPVNTLQEGRNTTFANGQVWTLKAGKPVRLR